MNRRNIFLLDGLGAVLSFVVTGIVLPFFAKGLGLPRGWLYGLALFPLVYAIYSFCCYRLRTPRPWMLITLIAANFTYCLVSGAVLWICPTLTFWGRALLGGEIAVILTVIAYETHTYRRHFR